jgi:GH25 family lysozyme M1 (1,4-beta-N-acetylmuramidase)
MTDIGLTGVDISHHQLSGPFEPAELPATVQYAYIRTTYGVRLDREFEAHFAEMREKRPEIALGPYHFYRQTQGWREQYVAWRDAMDRVDIREQSKCPALDMEWNTRYDGKVKPAHFSAECYEIAQRVRDDFGVCSLYLAPGFYQTLGEPEWMLDFPWWIAHFNVSRPWCPWKEWAEWQYGTRQTGAYTRPIDANIHKGELLLATKTPPWELDEIPTLPDDHGEPHAPEIDSSIADELANAGNAFLRASMTLKGNK